MKNLGRDFVMSLEIRHCRLLCLWGIHVVLYNVYKKKEILSGEFIPYYKVISMPFSKYEWTAKKKMKHQYFSHLYVSMDGSLSYD